MTKTLPLLRTVASAALFLGLTAALGGASPPSAGNSVVPPCLLTTPGGNIVTTIIALDLAGNPVDNVLVVIDCIDCPGFTPCPQQASDPYTVVPALNQIRMFSDAQGKAVFPIRAGGVCPAGIIHVYADGIWLRDIRAASADQNGDLSVDGADVVGVHAKIGTADLSGDLDCDADVDAADENLVVTYIGTNCLQPTEDRRRTWGGVKLIYR